MPKNKFQEVIFTIMMVLVMVYAMICYNIALATGGLTNAIFAAAFRELLFMAPLAFLLNFFLVSKIAFKKAYRIVNVKADNPFHLVLAISAVSVVCMCPLMSLAATLLLNMPEVNSLLSGSKRLRSISQWRFSGSFSSPDHWFDFCLDYFSVFRKSNFRGCDVQKMTPDRWMLLPHFFVFPD